LLLPVQRMFFFCFFTFYSSRGTWPTAIHNRRCWQLIGWINGDAARYLSAHCLLMNNWIRSAICRHTTTSVSGLSSVITFGKTLLIARCSELLTGHSRCIACTEQDHVILPPRLSYNAVVTCEIKLFQNYFRVSLQLRNIFQHVQCRRNNFEIVSEVFQRLKWQHAKLPQR